MTAKKKKSASLSAVFDELLRAVGFGKPKLTPSAECQDYSEIFYEQSTLKEVLQEYGDMDLINTLDEASQQLDLGPRYSAAVKRYQKAYELSPSDRKYMEEMYLLLFSEMGYSINYYPATTTPDE